MASQNLNTEIGIIVSALAGTRKTSNDFKMMRLLQLKRWLIEDEKDDLKILARAASAYASMRVTSIISEEISALRRNREESSPSSAVRSLIKGDHDLFMEMFDHSFIFRKGFSPMYSFRKDTDWNARIDSVCHYVELCLRLSDHCKGPFKGLAYKLYDFEASSKTSVLRKDIKPLMSARRSRLAFVYVARSQDEWLFEYPNSPEAMTALLAGQVEDVERFQTYFARCAYAQKTLARGNDVTGAMIERWSGTKAVRVKAPKAVPTSEIEAAERHYDEKGR